MDEFINKVEAFCNDGGFLEIGLRDPEVLKAYAETAQKLRRNNRKPLYSNDFFSKYILMYDTRRFPSSVHL